MENNQMDYYNYNQGMPQAPKKKRGSTLSILALVFSIIALPLTCFLVGVIFTILALILGVTALVLKQENKGLAIGGDCDICHYTYSGNCSSGSMRFLS